MRGLSRVLGADNAFWVGAHRESVISSADPMRGWTPAGLRYLFDHDALIAVGLKVAARASAGDPDPLTAAQLRGAGASRVFLRRELVDDRTWFASWVPNEHHRSLGIHDQLVGTNAVSARHESYLGFWRASRTPFGERERDLLRIFMDESNAMHRNITRARQIGGAHDRLTEREREVLRLLATDLTEKQIAARLQLGPRTVHQHALAIYRKLTVRGRVGLLAAMLADAAILG
jgi:DNA-binding CsgD family transcriptional regulator